MNLPPSPPQREQPRATQPPRPDSMSDAERLLGIVCGLARELRPNAPDVESLGMNHALERDFGLDSLARVELLVRIERELCTRLDEKAFIAAETPLDLLRLITTAAGAETPAPAGTHPRRPRSAPLRTDPGWLPRLRPPTRRKPQPR